MSSCTCPIKLVLKFNYSTDAKEDRRPMYWSRSCKVRPSEELFSSAAFCKCSSKLPESTRSCTTVQPSSKWLDFMIRPKPFGYRLWWLLSTSFALSSASTWSRKWVVDDLLWALCWVSFSHWLSWLSASWLSTVTAIRWRNSITTRRICAIRPCK